MDLGFGPHIEGRCGVVENEHPRVRQERSGKAQPLSLTSREREALLADDRVDPVREGLNEVQRFGLAKCHANLVVRSVGTSERNVGPNARGEEERIVVHHADATTKGVERHVLHVVAVDRDAAGSRVDEARQQQGDR